MRIVRGERRSAPLSLVERFAIIDLIDYSYGMCLDSTASDLEIPGLASARVELIFL